MGLRAVWHWNESALSIDGVIDLTKEMGGNAVILKAGYQYPIHSANFHRRNDFPASAKKVKDAGLMLLAEVYCVPGSWAAEAACLQWAVLDHKACAVVLNMEGPYEAESGEGNARQLLHYLDGFAPIWACTDFRGSRLTLPYHRALAAYEVGLMPMCYFHAFRPDRPFGDLQRAFDDVYWRWKQLGWDAPIIPVIQSYDGMDYEEMVGQIVLAWRWTKALGQKEHGTSIYAAHDCNPRAKWGVRDGWEIVEDAIRQAGPKVSAREVAAAAAAAARDAVLDCFEDP